MKPDNSTTRHDLRTTLIDNGFAPIPLNGKACFIKGWSTVPITKEWLEQYQRHSQYTNTGIRCGQVLAIDIDIDEPELAVAAERLTEKILGPTEWCRFGRGEKRLLLYRLPQGTHKRRTGKYHLPGDDTAMVEVLSTGQQFCAFGLHPDTQAPYEWDDRSPDVDPFDDLPIVMNKRLLDDLVERIDDLFEAKGLEQLSPPGSDVDGQYILTDDMVFDVPALGGYITVAELEANLSDDMHFQCNLTAIRPDSDSMAGVARLDHKGELCVVDFVAGCTYFRKEGTAQDLGQMLEDVGALEPGTLFNDPVTKLNRLVREYAYVAADGTVRALHDPTRAIKRDNFNHLHREKITRKNNTRVQVTTAWLDHPDAIKVTYSALRPDTAERVFTDARGVSVLNLYEPPDHGEPVPEDVALFYEFMEHLVPGEVERELVLDWIATKVQKPWLRMHGLVMVAAGVFGTGRGTLSDIMGLLLGEQYCTEVTLKHLVGDTSQAQYNDYLSQSLFVSVPEAQGDDSVKMGKWAAHKQAYENIKSVVDTAQRRTLIRRKGIANTPETVFASIFIATNHADAIAIEEGDRRLIVVRNGKVPLALVDDGGLMDELRAAMDRPEWVSAVFHELCEREVEYNPTGEPPMTVAKRNMIASSENGIDMAWKLFLEQCQGDICTDSQWRTFARHARDEYGLEWPDTHVADKALRSVIKAHTVPLELNNTSNQLKIDGKLYRPRVLRNDEKWCEGVDKEFVRREIVKNGDPGGDVIQFGD